MPRYSFQTDVEVCVGYGKIHIFDVWLDYDFSPAVPAYTPRGEYAPIDPPEAASAEIVGARWRPVGETTAPPQECPGWLIALLSEDDDLANTLIADAESSDGPDPDYLYEMRRDEPDEAQEWRDYDPDC